jgi:hypothetical protein
VLLHREPLSCCCTTYLCDGGVVFFFAGWQCLLPTVARLHHGARRELFPITSLARILTICHVSVGTCGVCRRCHARHGTSPWQCHACGAPPPWCHSRSASNARLPVARGRGRSWHTARCTKLLLSSFLFTVLWRCCAGRAAATRGVAGAVAGWASGGFGLHAARCVSGSRCRQALQRATAAALGSSQYCSWHRLDLLAPKSR